MSGKLFRSTVALLCLSLSAVAVSQQTSRIALTSDIDNDSLAQSRQRASRPAQTMRVANLGTMTVRNGDNSTERVRNIVIKSFEEQDRFAKRMNKAELVNASAIAALPEVNDEVLVYEDAIVVRRSTKIIVIDPERVARESELFHGYLGEQAARAPARATRAVAQPPDLDPEERNGLKMFMQAGVKNLHPKDPLRAAAARGEAALLEAIAAGKGELTIEDTLIIPTVSGVDQGDKIAIATIKNGILDIANPVPVKELSIKSLGKVDPDPGPDMTIKPIPAKPAERPPKRAVEPKHEASGKKTINAEFLLGTTRAANFQWERKWVYTSGYFRLTLGAGYAFGYRVPVVATAHVEPTRGFIRDYSDKKVIIGSAATAKTTNGNANFYKRAGLGNNLVKNGRELLLEANVGMGYKFRALWKTIASQPYTAIGVSYSQNFTPPNNPGELQGKQGGKTFGMTLDPKTTNISIKTVFIDGSATIKFEGRAFGALNMDMQSLVDNKVQKTFDVYTNKQLAAGAYPFKMTLDPIQLRQGQTTQTRPFGLRLLRPEYEARLIVLPMVKFGFRVGYKRLSRNFSTLWIPLNKLLVDTGNITMKPHSGTRSRFTWNEGEKIYTKIDKPDPGPTLNTKKTSSTPARAEKD